MSTPVQVRMPTGEVLWAQVAGDGPADGPSDVARSRALYHLDPDELRRCIQGVSGSVRAALAGMRPDEVSIEFGLEFTVKTGKLTSVLAEASGAATIKLTVSWTGDGAAAVTASPANDPAGQS